MERLSSIASKTFVDDLRSETQLFRGRTANGAPHQPCTAESQERREGCQERRSDGTTPQSVKPHGVNTSDRVADLAVSGRDQTLGDEYIKLAQAMILCTLPHSATKETKITRRARLGDGTTLAVTFSATADGVGLPHGADRKLLFWLWTEPFAMTAPLSLGRAQPSSAGRWA